MDTIAQQILWTTAEIIGKYVLYMYQTDMYQTSFFIAFQLSLLSIRNQLLKKHVFLEQHNTASSKLVW